MRRLNQCSSALRPMFPAASGNPPPLAFASLLFVWLFSLAPRPAYADLPIHCTLQDVAGDWEFHLGPSQPVNGKIPGCGHRIPNSATSMLSIHRDKIVPVKVAQTLGISLTEDIVMEPERHLKALSNGSSKTGSWTMVFDTGLEVRLGGQSLISHFHFTALPGAARSPENGDSFKDIGAYYGRNSVTLEAEGTTYACYCNMTSTGWWHRRSKDGSLEAGCLWGAKKGQHSMNGALASNLPPSYLVKIHPKDRQQQYHRQGKLIGQHALPAGMHSFSSMSVWNASEVHLERDMRPDSAVKEVIRIGSAPPPSPQQQKRTLLRGIRAHIEESKRTLHAETLPKKFDWREELAAMMPPGAGGDPLSDQIDQGACGSCYAFAGTMMLQMRFRVQLYRKHGILYPLELSYKSVTRCSPYTEGCSGGFSYFTSRVANEVGVPLASCDQAVDAGALDMTCDWNCHKNGSSLFYARDYYHVGGFSHGSDEQSIMREIYLNGPCELGFSTSAVPEFVALSGQSNYPETDVMTIIMNSRTLKEMYSTNPDVHRWWYATHAILAVGWGEDQVTWGSVKYWVVRNSWGRGWGQNGYAKMRRGNNDGGIETDASAVLPDMDRLPVGFLEEAKKFHKEQAPNRAVWRKAMQEASESMGKQGHQQPNAGLPEYCKKRPDSPDCK